MPNRAERRHPPKISPDMRAKLNAVKNGAKLADLKEIPIDPDAPAFDKLPPELREAAEKQGIKIPDGAASALAKQSKRAPRYLTLERELAALLSLPAIPCDALGDEFCANHFASQGPALAMQLTIYSESHKATYDVLVRLVAAGGILTLSTAVAMYALPPILHHAGGPEKLRQTFAVPDRPVPNAEEDKAA